MGTRTDLDLTGGLAHFDEVRSTAVPNDTVPAHRLVPSGAEAHIDLVLSPKGDGVIVAQVPDNTAVGGNKRGGTDFQLTRTNADEVASGDYSFLGGGFSNKATSDGGAVLAGLSNHAAGPEEYAAVVAGLANTASGKASVIGGGSGNAASGENSAVLAGQSSQATGVNAGVVAGNSNTAQAERSGVLAGTSNFADGVDSVIPGGVGNLTEGACSEAGGAFAAARSFGERARSSGTFPATGSGTAQHGDFHAFGITSGATPLVLKLDGDAAEYSLDPDEVYLFKVRVVGVQESTSRALATEVNFAVTNFGGTPAQLGTADVISLKITAATVWTVSPDLTSGVSVEVTGDTGDVRWSAEFQYCRVQG